MFKRKKEYRLIFLLNNNQIHACKLQELPIKESIVLQYSLEFFNDSAPCFIHRGAVTTRLLGEIEKSIESLGDNLILKESNIPQQLSLWLDLSDFDCVEITKQ